MNTQIFLFVIIGLGSFQSEDGTGFHESAAVAKIVFMQDIADVSNEDLSAALQQLRERTRQLEKELNLHSTTDQAPAAAAAEPSALSNMNEKESNKMAEIQRNIKLLKKVFKEKQRRKIQEQTQSQAAGSSTNDGSQNKRVPPGSTLNDFDAEQAPTDQNGNDESINEPVPAFKVPKQVVPRIVDAFELGNSLFLAGNLEQAIKYYELVPAERLSGFDRNWLELMIACCYRGKGDYEGAEASYREVAGDPNGLHAAEAAKNWLKYTATRKRLNGLVDEYGNKADGVLQSAEMLLEKIGNGKSN